jgi:predicted ATPase/DNA-binding SARP family transcriptional activator
MAVPSSPPVPLTSLVGRERELAELEALLPEQRLVTVTGVGGCGKTRLAGELALRVDRRSPGAVAWVELGHSAEPDLVAQQVAAALSLRPVQGGAVLEAIVDALRDRDLLLVLDDCEHLVEACSRLAGTLLRRCPSLRILATSREPLGIAGERIWPVPPISPEEAAQLFHERARAVDPSFALTEGSAAAVAEICRRLDGCPLSIELAAARTRMLTAEQIATRLEDRFSLLTGGARGVIPRHRTLRAAIDWSFALLAENEQALLARLSVFRGTFSLEAAEAVAGAGLGDVLDLLTGLVDKSLVVTTSRGAAVRYSLLQTIQHYAAERLAATGQTEAVRRAHALAYLAIARAVEIDPMGEAWGPLLRLEAEHDNVRAALAWAIEHEPDAVALPLAAAHRWFWYYRILWSEGLSWTTRVLERAAPVVSLQRAQVVTAAGTYAGYLGDLAVGRRWLEEAEGMWRALGEQRELALTLAAHAHLLANAGELDAAADVAAESVSLARAAGTRWDVGYCLANASAYVAQRRGELEEADRALEEAEALLSSLSHSFGLPFVLGARALLAMRRGDLAFAARRARAALVETRPQRYLWFAARALRVLAAASTGDPARAARLLGAADAMLRTIGARMPSHERAEQERLMASLREALPAEELEGALREGGTLSFEQACDLGLEVVEPASSEVAAAAGAGPLLEVADLGPLALRLGGRPVASEGRAATRVRELLAFFLAHPAGATKEEVGVAFWPNAASEQVKIAFHVTLHRLRKLLGDSRAVSVDGGRYRIAIEHSVDSQRFEAGISAALRRGDAEGLEPALALYTGDYLQGEDVGEWALPIRARLRDLCLRALFALGQAHESRGRYTDAGEAYARALAREPFHEPAARQLMICRARLGARSESLLVYRELERRLRDDLDAAPEPETTALYRRLLQNQAI